MGRGAAFTHSEDDLIITNAEHRTANELLELHNQLREDMMWVRRSQKSIARRVERLRDDGRLDVRDEATRRKAYYGRHNKAKE